jgi:transposase
MRKSKVKSHLSGDKLKEKYESAINSEIKKRWHLLWLVFTDKLSAVQASEFLGHTKNWGWYWITKYNEEGPEGIVKKRLRNPNIGYRKVPLEIEEELFSLFYNDFPEEYGGGLWNGPKVTLFLKKKYDIDICRRTGWFLLRKGGFTVQTGRPKHIGNSDENRETFKKNSTRQDKGA